jgi:hypothetical protein
MATRCPRLKVSSQLGPDLLFAVFNEVMTTPPFASQYTQITQTPPEEPKSRRTVLETDRPPPIPFRLTDFPVDIVHSLLSQLQNDSPTLNNLSQVAKAWHDLAIPYLYRSIDIRDSSMESQLLFRALMLSESNSGSQVQESNIKAPLSSLVQSLTLGLCPPSHGHGDFIYLMPHLLSRLTNLKRLELVKTQGETSGYWNEGNSNSILHRIARGELTNPFDVFSSQIYSHLTPNPQLTSVRIDVPIGPTLLSILMAQKPYLSTLELWHPQDRYSADDLIPIKLKKLAICGEKLVSGLGTMTLRRGHGDEQIQFEPTHLSLDHPSSTPLWPSKYCQSKVNYLSLPSTTHLRSLEISITLASGLESLLSSSDSPITFPSLVHFGIFTPRLADKRFLQQRKVLMTLVGRKYDAAKEMMKLLGHFEGLETLALQPEGVQDWMDLLLVDDDLFKALRSACNSIRLVMWRRHGERGAGAVRIQDDSVIKIAMEDIGESSLK